MGLIILITFYLVVIFLCFDLFYKSVLWVVDPAVKHLEYRDKERLKENVTEEKEEHGMDVEIAHQHEVAIENESQIIYVYKVVLNKILNNQDDNQNTFRR